MPYTSSGFLFVNRLQCKVEIELREVSGSNEAAALSLIRESHYQPGEPRGRVVAAYFVDQKAAAELRRNVAPPRIDPLLAGAAVVDRGCVRGKPKGREELANAHFPTLDLERTARNATVEVMGLAMINRVAVHETFRGVGIGRALASECRRFAGTEFAPPARFIEVMTTRRIDEARKLCSGAAKDDFLQRAGFVLVRRPTGRAWRSLGHGAHKELTVRLYYWAPAL